MSHVGPADDRLAQLRRKVAELERGRGTMEATRRAGTVWGMGPGAAPTGVPMGVARIDARFQGGGLPFGLHEVTPAEGAMPAPAMGFALMLMARTLTQRRDTMGLIIQSAGAEREGGGLYGPGLAALGLDPGRLVLVRVGRSSEALQVMDEALRSGAAAAVVAEVERSDSLTLAATQRLNFWAQDHDLMAFVASFHPSGNSAAMTRWQVAAAPSTAAVAWARRRGLRRPRLGATGLELVLSRNRRGVAGGGSSGRWLVEWNGEECGFRTPEALPASVAGATGHRPDTAVA